VNPPSGSVVPIKAKVETLQPIIGATDVLLRLVLWDDVLDDHVALVRELLHKLGSLLFGGAKLEDADLGRRLDEGGLSDGDGWHGGGGEEGGG
jgi:hypothetical protein